MKASDITSNSSSWCTFTFLLLGHSRMPGHSDVIWPSVITSEAALIYKSLASMGRPHLSVSLSSDVLEDEHGDHGDEHDAANDHCDGSARVLLDSLVPVVSHRQAPLGLLLGFLSCDIRGNFSSGFLAINGLLLAGHISGNLASFLWAEDVGADRDDLFESSDDIGLNHTLVQFDLVPLELAFLGSLDVKPSLHNRRINRPHSVLG